MVNDSSASTPGAKKARILFITLAAIFGVIGIQQFWEYHHAGGRYTAAIDQASRNLMYAKKLHAQSAKLARAVSESARSLSIMDGHFPAELETSQFIKAISRSAKDHAVKIENIQTSQSDYDFWKQVDITLQVSAEKSGFDAWLALITSGKRRVHFYLSKNKEKFRKVVLTLYSIPRSKDSPRKEDFCGPVAYSVWFGFLDSRLKAMQADLASRCSELHRYQAFKRTAEEHKKTLARLQRGLAIYHEIERKHALRLKNQSKI